MVVGQLAYGSLNGPTPVLVGLDIAFAEVVSARLVLLETLMTHRNRCLQQKT